jgi:hypothetical protein
MSEEPGLSAWDLAYSRCAPADAARSEELARRCNLRSSRGLPVVSRRAPQHRRAAHLGPPCVRCGGPTRGKGETGRPNASGICTECRNGMSSRKRHEAVEQARAAGEAA